MVWHGSLTSEDSAPHLFSLGRDDRLCAGLVWDFDWAFEDMELDRGGDIRSARFRIAKVRPLTVDSLSAWRQMV